MPAEKHKDEPHDQPEGLADDRLGPNAEAAREQGWGLNEDERKQQPTGHPAHYGGIGYDYGAQDFGDAPAKRDNPEGVPDQTEQEPRERKAS